MLSPISHKKKKGKKEKTLKTFETKGRIYIVGKTYGKITTCIFNLMDNVKVYTSKGVMEQLNEGRRLNASRLYLHWLCIGRSVLFFQV